MSVPETTSEARQQAEASTAGPVADILERLAEKLGNKASVSTVFGEPVRCDDVTIIPVARFGLGLGAGAGRDKIARTLEGGGGGASAVPVGFIEVRDGSAAFKPIRVPLTDVLVPLAVLIAGSAAPRIVRGLIRRRRGRA